MVTRRLAGVLCVAAAACGAASCAMVAGLDQEFRPAGEGGGGSGGSGGATTTSSTSSAGGDGGGGSGGGPVCVLATVPGPPAIADDGGDVSFVAAMRAIELDEKSFDVTLGLDVDGVCSCFEGAPQSCTPIAELVCDGEGGIDNAVGKIFATVYDFSSGLVSSGQLSKAANDGRWTNLIRVRGYNGAADDAKVEVMAYLTQGVNAGMPTPVWNGTDAWPVDDTSLVSPPDLDSALAVADVGYVAGGVLVFRITKEELRLRSNLFRMDLALSDVVVRAKLEAAPGGYKLLEGVISGQWPLTDVFSGIASIRYTGDSKLCTDDTDYLTVKEAICGNADLRRAGGEGSCDTL